MEQPSPEDIRKLRADALEFLETHRKMSLATLDKEGHPSVSMVLYAVDEQFNIFFGTRKVFGKYHALIADAHTSLTIVEGKVDPLKVVEIHGMAEAIPSERMSELLAWFTKKNPSPFYIKDEEDLVMFKIVPSNIKWIDASSGVLMPHDITVA